MESIPQYTFYKTKYGEELLIDIVELKDIKKYIQEETVHCLTYYDITYITEGSGTFCIDEHIYNVREGDLIFSRPGEIRQWDPICIINGYALIFEEEFLLSFFNDPNFIQNLFYFRTDRKDTFLRLKKESSIRIWKLMKEIQKEILSYEIKDKHILRALLYEALMYLNREYLTSADSVEPDGIRRNPYINHFIDLVNKDFRQSHSINYYADKLCITPNYLNEIVKCSRGINAKSLIQNKLLLEAKRMLVYTDMPIAGIAEELGFDNSSYFIRLFRKQTGLTPLQYRKEIKP